MMGRSGRTLMMVGLLALLALAAVGCGGRKSSLLLERQARGPLEQEKGVAKPILWALEPNTITKTQNGVEVTVTYATPAYLNQLFSNREIFGSYAGMNPYFREQLVFYVKITNKSGKKLKFDPEQFVLLDEKGDQYQTLGPDYGTALAESKASPVETTTRGIIDDAHPGYFGLNVPVGKLLAKSQQRFALMNMATLQRGFVYDGVTYDGLVAFWSPHDESTKLKLVLANIKTNFDPADVPQALLDFSFEFSAYRPQ